jgi:hypothetical protein
MFIKNQDGNAAIIFSVCAIPVMLAAGVAMDFNNLSKTRNRMQIALDTAALASASSDNGFSSEAASAYFKANSEQQDVKIIDLTFKKKDGEETAAYLKAEVPNSFLGLAGNPTSTLEVSSTAKPVTEKKLIEATFQITNAQGVYDKDIYFFTKDKDGKTLSETLILRYDYDSASGGKKTFIPKMNGSKTVKVGEHDTYGQRMIVYEDTTYKGGHINPKSYSSDDKNAASWTKISGTCDSKNKQTQNWEDGGDKNYLDFIFTMSCKTDQVKTGEVRLVE